MRKIVAACVFAAIWMMLAACVPAADRGQSRQIAAEAHPTGIGSMGSEEPITVPKPGGGQWILKWHRREYLGPWYLTAIDTTTRAVKQVTIPVRQLNLHLAPTAIGADGKLYVSALDRGLWVHMLTFDPATGDWTLGEEPLWSGLKGETHPLVVGMDGALYFFGSHPSGSAACVRYDPLTGQKQTFGPLGPAPRGGCWVGSAAADNRYLYIAAGRVPYYLVRHDRTTGDTSVLATTTTGKGAYMVVRQFRGGADATLTSMEGGTAGERVGFWLDRGNLIRKANKDEASPWGDSPSKARASRDPLNIRETEPDEHGMASISWLGGASASFKVPLSPVDVGAPVALPSGKLLLPLGFYQGIAVMDMATGVCKHVAKFELSHYATVVAGGKAYLSGYPSGVLYEYDPAQPGGAGNPRFVMNLKDVCGCHRMTSGALGADGKVYFCGQWYRDGNGGGLAWYDPSTGKADGLSEPFLAHQTQCMTATTDGRYIVFTSKRVEDLRSGQVKPKQGRLFVWDTRAGRITTSCDPVSDAKCAGRVVGVSPTEVVGWASDPADKSRSVLYRVDVVSGRVTATRTASFPCEINDNAPDNALIACGPDGKVLLFSAGLRRIDPASLEDTLLGSTEASGKGWVIGHDLWYGAGGNVYRIPAVTQLK